MGVDESRQQPATGQVDLLSPVRNVGIDAGRRDHPVLHDDDAVERLAGDRHDVRIHERHNCSLGGVAGHGPTVVGRDPPGAGWAGGGYGRAS